MRAAAAGRIPKEGQPQPKGHTIPLIYSVRVRVKIPFIWLRLRSLSALVSVYYHLLSMLYACREIVIVIETR
jgi:hypothetical protein